MEVDFSRLHVHIIGLGLMGGSLAMVLKNKVARITAEDTDATVIREALQQKVIHTQGERQYADIIVLAVPVHLMPDIVEELPGTVKNGALIIDLGSTKSVVCGAFDKLPVTLRAVGGHPMCGLAENSFQNAIPHLYKNARFVLCETRRTDAYARYVAEQVVSAAEAQGLWLERTRHDFLTAVTSHLPHLMNFALMKLAVDLEAENDDLFELAAGGFDGATRLARTHESMITGMFTTNAENLRYLTTRLIDELQILNTLLDNPENLTDTVHDIVEARRDYSSRYGERLIT
jgi:prephenate dehydrogenase